MPSYEDLKQIYNDIKTDKIMMWIFRIMLTVLAASLIITGIAAWIRGANDKPVSYLWGLYECKHSDTIISVKKDTVTVYVPKIVYGNTTTKTSPEKQENKNGDNNNAGRDNNGVQGGKDNKNHIVNGINNGVNGDYINKERELNDSDKQNIIQLITYVEKQNNISNRHVLVFKTQNSNAGKFVSELSSFLIAQGYDSDNTSGGTSPQDLVGYTLGAIKCDNDGSGNGLCVFITVGRM